MLNSDPVLTFNGFVAAAQHANEIGADTQGRGDDDRAEKRVVFFVPIHRQAVAPTTISRPSQLALTHSRWMAQLTSPGERMVPSVVVKTNSFSVQASSRTARSVSCAARRSRKTSLRSPFIVRVRLERLVLSEPTVGRER